MPLRLLLITFLLFLPALASSDALCPDDVLNAAELHRMGLNGSEELTKNSTVESPVRVEPSQAFDVSTHDCHVIPGQAYRVYDVGECVADPSGKKCVVRYPYRLFFRRGLTVEALYKEAWKEGSDGILQVTFEKGERGWTPVSRRESLQLGGSKPKGPPAP